VVVGLERCGWRNAQKQRIMAITPRNKADGSGPADRLRP
jgi:hypothetical protein